VGQVSVGGCCVLEPHLPGQVVLSLVLSLDPPALTLSNLHLIKSGNHHATWTTTYGVLTFPLLLLQTCGAPPSPDRPSPERSNHIDQSNNILRTRKLAKHTLVYLHTSVVYWPRWHGGLISPRQKFLLSVIPLIPLHTLSTLHFTFSKFPS